jgi:O-antigen/teichoic acid export membrane protein
LTLKANSLTRVIVFKGPIVYLAPNAFARSRGSTGCSYAACIIHAIMSLLGDGRGPSAVARARAFAVERGDVIWSSLSSLALRIGGMVSAFGLGVILARALGPAEFGIYGLVIAVATLAATASQLGTPQLTVRELSVCSARGDWGTAINLLSSFTLATIAVSLVGSVAALLIAVFVIGADGRTLNYVLLGAIVMPLLAISGVIASALRDLGAMFKGQVLDIFGRPALAVAVLVLLLAVGIRLDATIALWVQVAVIAVAVVISFAWVRNVFPVQARSIQKRWQLGWITAALPLGAVDVVRQVDGTFGMVLMGWLASDTALGIFRVALSCAIVAALPAAVLHIVQAPVVARLHGLEKKAELQRLLRGTSAALVALIAPITLASWLIGRPAIELVFGEVYGDAWLPLSLLCCGQLVAGFFGMGPILLAMCNGERYLIKIYLLAVGTAVAAAFPLIHAFGASGAAAAQIVSVGLVGILSWRYARNVLGLEITCIGPRR